MGGGRTAPIRDYSVIGKRLPSIDAVAKTTGEAKYTGDLVLPRMLHGKILRSPYPHARVLTIDTSRAERLPGVRAVITGKDTLGIKYGDIIPDEYALAVDKVRYIGDAVAAVAAIDEDTAAEALDLIRVEYQELPAIFDPEEAMKPGAPSIHDDVPNNVSAKPGYHFGNVEAGFRESDYVREDTFRTQAQSHCALEPLAALASHDSTGKVTLWASTQNPYPVSKDLAKVLGIPLGNVRVIKPSMGGGFGGKRDTFDLFFCTALLSRKTGRPVRIAYTREEQFIAGRHRHPFVLKLKVGVRRDGTLIAKEWTAIADGGAYNSVGPAVVGSAGTGTGTLYRVANAKYTGYHVYTNKPVCGAFRGFGLLQTRFADEVQMDLVAKELGMDPAQLRLKNAIRSGDPNPMRWKITSCGLSECIQKAAEAAEWEQRWGKLPKEEGVGMACNNYVCGSSLYGPDSSAALVKLHEDGTVTLFTGVADIGQGSDTTLAQIAAEELGLSLEDIRMCTSDTETTPTDLGSYASRVTVVGGNAVRIAAGDAKRQVLELAAQMLEARVEDLVSSGRRIHVQGSPEKGIAFSEMIRHALVKQGVHILGRGSYAAPSEQRDPVTRQGNTSPAYSFGAQVVRVEVDRDTGQIAVHQDVAAYDCGLAINPMGLEGQIEGSVVCGLGMTLMEDRVTERGQVLNPSFEGYKVPTALEAPLIDCIFVETIDPEGPFGAKGLSEGAQVPVAPAIANALFDATGVRLTKLPLTPESVLEGLDKRYKDIQIG